MKLAPIPLGPYETRDISLEGAFGLLPLPLPFGSIRTQYSGPRSLGAHTGKRHASQQYKSDRRDGASAWDIDREFGEHPRRKEAFYTPQPPSPAKVTVARVRLAKTNAGQIGAYHVY